MGVSFMRTTIKSESDNYEEAKRLINFINNFFSIPDNAIPETSILREIWKEKSMVCYN